MLPQLWMGTNKNRWLATAGLARSKNPRERSGDSPSSCLCCEIKLNHGTGRPHSFRNPYLMAGRIFFLLVISGILAGCTPSGPGALLDGKRLIEKGKYRQAVEKLKTSTTLLATNAQAWNYLGLAYHYSGQSGEAEKAYQRALFYNHDLTEAHYNLGCLWLEQSKTNAARTEFIAFTLRRPNSPEGLLKLGVTQLRARDFVAAEKSFTDSLRLNSKNPEALNG